MKIGLISDTHGFLDEKVFKYFEHCDEIWHAGDIGTVEVAEKLKNFKPLKGVYGNIDGQDIRLQFSKDLRFSCEGKKIYITHIGGYPPKYNREVLKQLQAIPPDIFICGHSHILKIMQDTNINNLLHINPGAAGVQGFHKVRTIVRFNLSDNMVSELQVIELGNK
ncbi:MAG: metallophosphatase family protein [Bacteroidota bacterium]|jgi:putative phosphoesterase|nr:metallophosphatase family protein [Bacteroidota bacterium]